MVMFKCDGKSKKNCFFLVIVWKGLFFFSQKFLRALSKWKKLKFSKV